jgi:LacI family transcriptional regulator
VLNNQPKAQTFSPATRQKIKEVADRLGYIPNAAARALVTNRTYNIGFIIPEYASQRWSNQFYSDMLNGIDDVCYQHNYSLFVHCCNLSDALDFVFPRGITERNVDGLIISNAVGPEILKRFEELNIPCVRVGTPGGISKSVIPEFSPDLIKGYSLALEYLSRLGHRRIALFNSGSLHSRHLAEQLQARLTASAPETCVALSTLFTGNGKCDESSAREFVSEYFNYDESMRPTAVITNPQTCLGIFNELGNYNLAYPEDLSLISNYNYNLFDYVSPGITSLQYDNAAIAGHAARLLLDMIDGKLAKGDGIAKTDFPVTLNVRQSCVQVS